VPDNVPVVTLAPATRTDLIAGKKVVVVSAPLITALYRLFVLVEKDGVVPTI